MRYFKTIVEEGTISKAAKVLHMAQPPLSMQLKQLEEELGVMLLKRGKKQIELTDAGTQFYKRCLQILDLTEITKNELQQSYQELLLYKPCSIPYDLHNDCRPFQIPGEIVLCHQLIF